TSGRQTDNGLKEKLLFGIPFEKILDGGYGEFGIRLDEVMWLSRGCSSGGMVEQADMSIGIKYDVWIIIGATHIGIKGRCASRVSEPSVP
ncbi:hypothetical protein A2U01_0001242, partial [Trifolium medium]|nr:hypothetical protein [Trifolium medium]